MQPESLNNGTQASRPFQFQPYSDLIGEMCVEDLYRSRPATVEEAVAIGRLYKDFDEKDPFGSVERALGGYACPTDRHVILIGQRRGEASHFHVIRDANGFKIPVPFEGLLSYFMKRVEVLLVERGVPLARARENLYPAAIAEADTKKLVQVACWVVGVDTPSGLATILDCTKDMIAPRIFLSGASTFATPDFGRLKR